PLGERGCREQTRRGHEKERTPAHEVSPRWNDRWVRPLPVPPRRARARNAGRREPMMRFAAPSRSTESLLLLDVLPGASEQHRTGAARIGARRIAAGTASALDLLDFEIQRHGCEIHEGFLHGGAWGPARRPPHRRPWTPSPRCITTVPATCAGRNPPSVRDSTARTTPRRRRAPPPRRR